MLLTFYSSYRLNSYHIDVDLDRWNSTLSIFKIICKWKYVLCGFPHLWLPQLCPHTPQSRTEKPWESRCIEFQVSDPWHPSLSGMTAASPPLVQYLCCSSLAGPRSSLSLQRNVPILLKRTRVRRLLLTRCYTLHKMHIQDRKKS